VRDSRSENVPFEFEDHTRPRRRRIVRRSIERLVRSTGFGIETFGSAEDFLEFGNLDRTGCTMTPLLILMANAALEST